MLGFPGCAGSSAVAASGGCSLLAVCGLPVAGASLVAGRRPWGTQASAAEAHGPHSRSSRALEHAFSSCGAQAQLLCAMQHLPGPRTEPMSPALAGGLLTTGPPGKSFSIRSYKKKKELYG